jgi:hypothetical protein
MKAQNSPAVCLRRILGAPAIKEMTPKKQSRRCHYFPGECGNVYHKSCEEGISEVDSLAGVNCFVAPFQLSQTPISSGWLAQILLQSTHGCREMPVDIGSAVVENPATSMKSCP